MKGEFSVEVLDRLLKRILRVKFSFRKKRFYAVEFSIFKIFKILNIYYK